MWQRSVAAAAAAVLSTLQTAVSHSSSLMGGVARCKRLGAGPGAAALQLSCCCAGNCFKPEADADVVARVCECKWHLAVRLGFTSMLLPCRCSAGLADLEQQLLQVALQVENRDGDMLVAERRLGGYMLSN